MRRYRTLDKPGHQQKLKKKNSLYVERRRIIEELDKGHLFLHCYRVVLTLKHIYTIMTRAAEFPIVSLVLGRAFDAAMQLRTRWVAFDIVLTAGTSECCVVRLPTMHRVTPARESNKFNFDTVTTNTVIDPATSQVILRLMREGHRDFQLLLSHQLATLDDLGGLMHAFGLEVTIIGSDFVRRGVKLASEIEEEILGKTHPSPPVYLLFSADANVVDTLGLKGFPLYPPGAREPQSAGQATWNVESYDAIIPQFYR